MRSPSKEYTIAQNPDFGAIKSMKHRLFTTVFALLCASTLNLKAQFVWTGGSLLNGWTGDALNWQLNFPLTPQGTGNEDVTFGNLGILATQTNPLVPTTSLRDITFNGNNRPVYTFSGYGGTRTLTLDRDIDGNQAGTSNSAVTFDSTLNLLFTSRKHRIDLNNMALSIRGNIGETGGSADVEFRGGGFLHLSGTNNFTGGIDVKDGGSLFLENSSAAGTGVLTFRNDTKLWGSSGFVSLANSVKLQNGMTTINSTGAGETLTFTGNISNSGGLIKAGPGTLILSGANTYGGGTDLNSGTLIANHNSALGSDSVVIDGGTLTVNSGITLPNTLTFGANGGTITGSGTISSSVIVGTFATLSPGSSPGTLSFSSGLTLAGSGTLNFEVQTAAGLAGTGYDLLSVSGAVLNITATAGSPFTISLRSLDGVGNAGNISDFSSATPYTWTIANSAAGISNFSTNKFLIDSSGFTNGLGGGTFSLSATGTSLYLNFTPVPEPSTYVLMAVGLGMAVMGMRRRRA